MFNAIRTAIAPAQTRVTTAPKASSEKAEGKPLSQAAESTQASEDKFVRFGCSSC